MVRSTQQFICTNQLSRYITVTFDPMHGFGQVRFHLGIAFRGQDKGESTNEYVSLFTETLKIKDIVNLILVNCCMQVQC